MFDKDELNKFYRYAISLTQDGDLAYDLLQSALERYLKKVSKAVENPNAYLKTIIRNLFIDHERRKKVVPMISMDNEEILNSDNYVEPTDDRSMDDVLITRQEALQLTKLLTPEENELLYLWAVEEYSTAEISVISQQPKGTILSKLHRLKKRVREQFAADTQAAKKG